MVEIIRDQGLKCLFRYFGLHKFFIGGAVTFLLLHVFWRTGVSRVSVESFTYQVCHKLIPWLVVAVWVLVIFTHLRRKVYFYLTGRTFRKDSVAFHKGFRELLDFYKDADLTHMDIDKLPTRPWRQSGGLVFGKSGDKLISFEPERNGIVSFVWGSPGDGKTASVIIPSCRQFGMGKNPVTGEVVQRGAVMVTDLKGDIFAANHDYRRIKRFSTIHPEDSCHYDPLVDARNMEPKARATFIEDMAFTLVPDEDNSDSQYFVSGARDFFSGIALFLLDQDDLIAFPEIIDQIVRGNYFDWVTLIKDSEDRYAQAYTNHFFGENEKNVAGTYSKLVSSVRLFNSDIMQSLLTDNGDCISPQDLEDLCDIYIQIDPNQVELYSPVISMIYQSFMSQMLYRTEGQDPPIAFVIDEFGQIPAMPVISQSAALMRAYNCSLLFSCQSLAMIEKHYGVSGRKILMDCVKAHVFLSINDPDTRDWASRLIGSKKVLRISDSQQVGFRGVSSGQSVSETREKIFEPEYFGFLPQENVSVIYYNGMYVKAEKTYFFAD